MLKFVNISLKLFKWLICIFETLNICPYAKKDFMIFSYSNNFSNIESLCSIATLVGVNTLCLSTTTFSKYKFEFFSKKKMLSNFCFRQKKYFFLRICRNIRKKKFNKFGTKNSFYHDFYQKNIPYVPAHSNKK